MNRLCLSLGLFFVLSETAFAQNQSTDIRPSAERLIGTEITNAFSDVTHKGSYNFDRSGFASNHYIEEHFPDGRVIYYEGKLHREGVWFENNDTLCFVYKDNLMNGGCFRVYQVENCFYYFSDQIQLTEWELGEDYWTARSVVKGEMPQCEPAIS